MSEWPSREVPRLAANTAPKLSYTMSLAGLSLNSPTRMAHSTTSHSAHVPSGTIVPIFGVFGGRTLRNRRATLGDPHPRDVVGLYVTAARWLERQNCCQSSGTRRASSACRAGCDLRRQHRRFFARCGALRRSDDGVAGAVRMAIEQIVRDSAANGIGSDCRNLLARRNGSSRRGPWTAGDGFARVVPACALA